MLGVALEPPQRLRRGSAANRISGRNETISARAKPPSSTRCISGGKQAPQLEQRHHEKDRDHQERPQQRLPDALGEQGKPAQAARAVRSAGRARYPPASLGEAPFGRSRTRIVFILARGRGTTGQFGERSGRKRGRITPASELTASPAAAPWPACRRRSAAGASRQAVALDQHLGDQRAACCTRWPSPRHRRRPS